MSDILGRVKACRRVSVPLVAYATSDQNATIAMLADGINGETPKIAWDFCNGVVPLNQDGQDAIASAGIDPSDTAANPAGTLQAAVKLPKRRRPRPQPTAVVRWPQEAFWRRFRLVVFSTVV